MTSRKLDVMGLLAETHRLSAESRGEEAAQLFQSWLAANPDDPLAFTVHFNLGTLLLALGRPAEAASALEQAVERKPDFLPPYVNLGNAYEQSNQRPHAIAAWNRLVAQLPGVTRENIDFKLMALKQIGRVFSNADLDDPAEQALKQSIDLDATQSDVLQNWLNLRQKQCRWPIFDPLTDAQKRRVLEEMSPLTAASQVDDPLWQLAHAAAFTRKEVGRPDSVLPPQPPPDPTPRVLKIGYLSADLWEHAVGFLTAEIYGLHDRGKVEVGVYYNGPAGDGQVHRRIRAGADRWRDIRGVRDADAARMIAEDGIDILVDLSGHTKDARTALLGRNPAPIIVNWLGFPGSMGSPFHHYLIADGFIVPEEMEPFYSERVLRLPCYQPVDRQRRVSPAPPSRAEAGLPEDAMVFCCFNESRKITENTWQRWMRILREVPDSVLWLLIPSGTTQSHLQDLAIAEGVAKERLVFAARQLNHDHLARYVLADLILDSFPYGAHTTASDALWMGVPVLTLAGRSFASRVCGSLLQAAGLPELICATEEAYAAKALELANDPAQRAALRKKLRESRDRCLLFDTPRLVRSLEGLYARMWEDYCQGRLPKPDLVNMELYREIGMELVLDPPPDPDLLGHYRRQLAERRNFSFVQPDRRLARDPD
jgi:predicted O-linked N-acetylglucosamine transferase (SPINDLY family)